MIILHFCKVQILHGNEPREEFAEFLSGLRHARSRKTDEKMGRNHVFYFWGFLFCFLGQMGE